MKNMSDPKQTSFTLHNETKTDFVIMLNETFKTEIDGCNYVGYVNKDSYNRYNNDGQKLFFDGHNYYIKLSKKVKIKILWLFEITITDWNYKYHIRPSVSDSELKVTNDGKFYISKDVIKDLCRKAISQRQVSIDYKSERALKEKNIKHSKFL